jgi:SAM-dependent methyltransferase
LASTGAGPDGLIDAHALASMSTVEELALRADELVRSMADPTALLAKPCSTMREAPDLLASFGMLLGALQPLPGMTVLDFGAGTCWTSHFLTQLGCRVVAMDVSPAMLELGRRRFTEQPLFGDRPEPSFSLFDGTRMDLADASIERVLCFDALHHVPNVPDVLAEMSRVLSAGGVAGFSEPGPYHSSDVQSQHEMRRYGVPEFDLVLEDVWAWASAAGFADLSVAVYSPFPQWVTLERFSAFLGERPGAGPSSARVSAPPSGLRRTVFAAQRALGELRHPSTARAAYRQVDHVRETLRNRRMFVLSKAGKEVPDSRDFSGLAADLELEAVEVVSGHSTTTVRGVCRVRNTGNNRWLASSAGRGAVLLGLRVGRGARPATDHGRVALPGDAPVDPGTAVVVPFVTDITDDGGEDVQRLELDLVAEGITWFAEVHGEPLVIELGDGPHPVR